MSIHVIPKNGEPRYLIESYWDKKTKTHKTRKLAYIYMWRRDGFLRLKRLHQNHARITRDIEKPEHANAYRKKGQELANSLLGKIQKLKRDETTDAWRKRRNVDGRAKGGEMQRWFIPPSRLDPRDRLNKVCDVASFKSVRDEFTAKYYRDGAWMPGMIDVIAGQLKPYFDEVQAFREDLGI
jgi:hypothetical protein